jgi:hypothetical protein
VTHAAENGVLRELRRPYWTSYSMDSEIPDAVGLPPSQRYISPDELMFDCMDFTVPDVAPVASVVMDDAKCPDFTEHDANHSGVHDACESPAGLACVADADCNDCRFCNGEEACVSGVCAPGTPPCSSEDICDDVADVCLPPPPCPTESTCSGCQPGAIGCAPAGSSTDEDLGFDRCVRPDGPPFSCSSGASVHLVTTQCTRCPCCKGKKPSCVCPEACGPKRELVCGPEEY